MIVEELINLLQHQNPKANVELWAYYSYTAEDFHADQGLYLDATEPNKVIIKATNELSIDPRSGEGE